MACRPLDEADAGTPGDGERGEEGEEGDCGDTGELISDPRILPLKLSSLQQQ